MTVQWSKSELEILGKMNLRFDVRADLSDPKIEKLYDLVPEYLLDHGLDKGDEHNQIGETCEDMITKLAMVMKARGLLA